MSQAIKQSESLVPEMELSLPAKILGLWPVIVPMLATVALVVARIELGPGNFLKEGALTLLALICYMSAAVIAVTNLFVKERVLSRLGLITIAIGYCFNLSGWMIRWVEAGDAEGWKEGINGAWRYFPLDNLYPLTLGFCAGAAVTTLVIVRKPKFEFLSAMSMPIVTVILTLAIFLGNEIRTLPPILDSYWRPIHVSIATIGYGVCLVSFGIAFAYLLKDGVRSEAIAIAACLFGLLIYGTIGRFGVPFHGEYGVALFFNKTPLPARAVLPGVGPLMVVALLAIVASLLLFTIDWIRTDEKARRVGWRIFKLSAALQAVVLIAVFSWVAFPQKMSQMMGVSNFVAQIPAREKPAFGEYLNKQMSAGWPADRHQELADKWLQQEEPSQFTINMKSNPVEFGGLIGLFVVLVMVSLFAWRREDVVSAIPSLQSLDGLLYRTVGVAFPLLSLLLITGAVWANESWGRYWGWDSKEVGALVAWMAYAGFLHTRISHGWRGRRSAYFALLGFALVIFTWLGVSYLLPGLHSYA